jgi:hypothetical protein
MKTAADYGAEISKAEARQAEAYKLLFRSVKKLEKLAKAIRRMKKAKRAAAKFFRQAEHGQSFSQVNGQEVKP